MWERLSQQLAKEASYLLEDVNEEQLERDVLEVIAFGNHKEAAENTNLFRNMMEEDVTHGFLLIILKYS